MKSTTQSIWFKTIASTIASGLAMWLIAGLWHTIIAVNFYSSETHAQHKGLGIILLAYFILGFLMSYLYQYVFKYDCSISRSMVFGGVVGLLWIFPHELAMAGAHNTSVTYVIKNASWHVIEQGIGGLTVGWIFKKIKIG